jgi:splicing factor 3A subunit 2
VDDPKNENGANPFIRHHQQTKPQHTTLLFCCSLDFTMTTSVAFSRPLQFLVATPSGRTATLTWGSEDGDDVSPSKNYEEFLSRVVDTCGIRDGFIAESERERCEEIDAHHSGSKRRRLMENAYLVHEGKVLSDENFCFSSEQAQQEHTLQLRFRIRGGTDRQNRVGSKFGGGGVSSSQQTERERKDRLKKLALESIDLAKDPYLVRNHLGSYECKLCLTLHRDEANYLAHTQGKKHQQGLARRAHMEKLKEDQEGTAGMPVAPSTKSAHVQNKVRIGRPAYQVFKSRDAETNQRCLSFELQYPEIGEDLQPRHRFMSAFEQRVDSPPDRRYQYLLFAAEPYETVAFKIPNEPIDKGENRFVTHWDSEGKKFTVTLYFEEGGKTESN